jgi:CRISPR-associated protein (TIGR03984 family)
MSEAKLFVHQRERIGLAEAITAFARIRQEGDVVALLYSPRSCKFALLSSGSLHGSDAGEIDLRSVFEARVFGTKAELRWLNDASGEGQHRAVVLAEEDCSQSLGEDWSKTEIADNETLPQTYLLWGEGTGKGTGEPMREGWSKLGAARIGALPVPLANVEKNQRVRLVTREYLKAEEQHGNVLVHDERLCKLEVERG